MQSSNEDEIDQRLRSLSSGVTALHKRRAFEKSGIRSLLVVLSELISAFTAVISCQYSVAIASAENFDHWIQF